MATVCLINSHERFLREIHDALSTSYLIHCFHDAHTGLDAAKMYNAAVVLVGLQELRAGGGVMVDKICMDPVLRVMPIVVVGDMLQTEFERLHLPLPNAVYLQRPFRRSELLKVFANLISGEVAKAWKQLDARPRQVLEQSAEAFTDWQAAVDGGVPINLEATSRSCEPLVDAIQNQDIVNILSSVKLHHDYTYVHSMRVATYLSVFAHAVGIKEDQLQIVATGGLLHDVGKISTPDAILNKPGRLEGEEWETMKDHVTQSSEILKRNDGISTGIRIIAGQHHEKLDGSGYPNGLVAKDLSELARMSTIADIFSALTDERTYKKAFSLEKSFEILESMDQQLDQSLVRIFKDVVHADKENLVPGNHGASEA